jgi:hypothetical protein
MSDDKIRVRPAYARQEGRCNACQGSMETSDRVWMVDVRSASTRYCDACAAELIAKLHQAFRRVAREMPSSAASPTSRKPL